MRVFPTPRYKNVKELLDSSAEATEHELRGTLRDIRRANLFGMGTWVVRHHLDRLLADRPPGSRVRVLDLATGSADIPQALLERVGRHHRLKVVATDVSHSILRLARQRIEQAGFADQVEFAVCDATRLPFDDGEFDYVVLSLALHHLDTEQARLTIQNMARVGRYGLVINDIYRSRGAWYMARFLTRVTTANRLTRHDGPASVIRAFTPREVARLGREAGVPLEIHKHPFWRMAAVYRRAEDG